MKVDGSLHSLIQGVSQQPPKIRLPGQCTAQENCSSNPVDGLTRRPPTDHVATLMPLASDAIYHDFTINGTDYILVLVGGAAYVFDTDGNAKDVTLGTGAATYLTGAKMSFTNIEKDTYIANGDITVLMDAATKTYSPSATLIHLVGGQYGRAYKVTVNWGVSTQTITYTSPNGATATDTPKVATTYIATQLQTAFNANGTLAAVFDIARKDDVLYITSTAPASANFTVTVDDGDGGSRLYVTNNTVIDVGTLPRFAPHGYFVSVTGSGTADVDDYYLQFEVTGGSTIGNDFGKPGIWVEAVQRNIEYLLNTATMPFIMAYDPDADLFTISAGDWKGRQVGDEETNENPSFVDNTISGLSHFQGRLVILSGENRVMSRTNKPLDFWRESATVLADSDPIDESSTTKSANLKYAVQFNRDLIIFAETAQFVTFGRTALTPLNSSLVLTTEFEADMSVKPVTAGKNIFYAIQVGNFTGIREFFNEQSIDTNDARPITQHVLKYLRGRVTKLSSSTTFDILLVQTDFDARTIYAYEYIWIDNSKKQASWSTWNFRNPITHKFLRGNTVYLLSTADGNLLLEKMNLGIQNDDGLDYTVMLDGKVEVGSVGISFANPLGSTEDVVFVQGAGCPNPGLLAEVETITLSTITLKHDQGGGKVIAGHTYHSSYKPTLPFVRDKDNVAIGTGTLIIREFIVNYIKTGYFEYALTSNYTDGFGDYFSGRIIADPENIVGAPNVTSGSYTVPFRENARLAELEIKSSSHLPFTITDLEWEGQYIKKGQRISGGG